MGDTTIAWTDKVWNPVTGCTKVSQGCKHCYAERVFPRAYSRPDKSGAFRKFTDVRCHPERLDQPLRWRKPCRIFVNSMSDLFHEDIPSAFIDAVFHRMSLAPQHTFQILTKRPERMRSYLRGGSAFAAPLPNVWPGVSVEDQATADERIPLLLKTPAAVRFVSYEPALGPVNFSPDFGNYEARDYLRGDYQYGEAGDAAGIGGGVVVEKTARIDQVIFGGESGPNARHCNIEWARQTRDQCKAAGTAFFMKQTGTDHAALYERVQKNRAGADPTEWPEDLRIQEFPE